MISTHFPRSVGRPSSTASFDLSRWIHPGSYALSTLLFAGTAAAQSTPIRLDFGSTGVSSGGGYTQVQSSDLYGGSGFGWAAAGYTMGFSGSLNPDIIHNLDDKLVDDGAQCRDGATFRVDVAPNTDYVCVVYCGSPIQGNHLMKGGEIRCQGVLVKSGLRPQLLRRKGDYNEAESGYRRVTFRANSGGDGRLDFQFRTVLGSDPQFRVLGLEVYDAPSIPVQFDHTKKGLEAPVGAGNDCNLFVQRMNLEDFDAARALVAQPNGSAVAGFDGSALEHAWCLAWYVGWLKGDEVSLDAVLPLTLEGLLAPMNHDDAAVALLHADVLDLRRGHTFCRARAYTTPPVYDDPDNYHDIGKNLNAGYILLEQIDGNLFALPALSPEESSRFESPLEPQAKFLLATFLYGANTAGFKNPPTQAEFCQKFVDDFQALWDRVSPGTDQVFTKAADVVVQAWRVTQFDSPTRFVGPLPSTNPFQTLPAATAPRWWNDVFAYTPVAPTSSSDVPPDWAVEQVRHRRLVRSLSDWWFENRGSGSEFGGGFGDDVELLAGFATPSIALNETSGSIEAGIKEYSDNVLNGSALNFEEGYHQIPIDAEHGGEYTTNPLRYLVPAHFGEPEYLEFVMRTMRNLKDAHQVSPNPWSFEPTWWSAYGGNPARPGRHLKSYILGADAAGVTGTPTPLEFYDCTENLRPMATGALLVDYNRGPEISEMWLEYARAWALTARGIPSINKPAGVFAPIVNNANGRLGHNNNWYADIPGVQDGSYNRFYRDFYYVMLWMAERAGGADRTALLRPVLDAANNLNALGSSTYVNNLSTNPSTYEGALAKSKQAIATGVSLSKALITSIIGSQPTSFDPVIDSYGPVYAKVLNATDPTAAIQNVTDLFAAGTEELRTLWPLVTTAVSYVDRVNFGQTNRLLDTMTGAPFMTMPNYKVTWATPSESDESELGIFVHRMDPDAGIGGFAMEAMMYNFRSQAQPLRMRIWRGIAPGSYDLIMETGTTTQTISTFDYVGRAVGIDIPGIPSGEQVTLKLRRNTVGQIDSTPLPDIALSANGVTLNGSTSASVQVHNLGSADYSGGGMVKIFSGGTEIGSAGIGVPIEAPNDLTPRSVTIVVPITGTLPPAGSAIRVRAFTNVTEITTENDAVKIIL